MKMKYTAEVQEDLYLDIQRRLAFISAELAKLTEIFNTLPKVY